MEVLPATRRLRCGLAAPNRWVLPFARSRRFDGCPQQLACKRLSMRRLHAQWDALRALYATLELEKPVPSVLPDASCPCLEIGANRPPASTTELQIVVIAAPDYAQENGGPQSCHRAQRERPLSRCPRCLRSIKRRRRADERPPHRCRETRRRRTERKSRNHAPRAQPAPEILVRLGLAPVERKEAQGFPG